MFPVDPTLGPKAPLPLPNKTISPTPFLNTPLNPNSLTEIPQTPTPVPPLPSNLSPPLPLSTPKTNKSLFITPFKTPFSTSSSPNQVIRPSTRTLSKIRSHPPSASKYFSIPKFASIAPKKFFLQVDLTSESVRESFVEDIGLKKILHNFGMKVEDCVREEVLNATGGEEGSNTLQMALRYLLHRIIVTLSLHEFPQPSSSSPSSESTPTNPLFEIPKILSCDYVCEGIWKLTTTTLTQTQNESHYILEATGEVLGTIETLISSIEGDGEGRKVSLLRKKENQIVLREDWKSFIESLEEREKGLLERIKCSDEEGYSGGVGRRFVKRLEELEKNGEGGKARELMLVATGFLMANCSVGFFLFCCLL